MNRINVLDMETINKIAAGEVIERPASIVKELVENSIDSNATSITVEIKDGGSSLIRITDNGSGIECADVRTAFLRHATSKIKSSDDLNNIVSLGFRGEALSSIAAVSRTEMITKTAESLTGIRYVIEGGIEKYFEEIGALDGTTIIVRDIFYNTPARRKFLKSDATESSHICDFVEKIALSHPDISFRLISNNQNKLQTIGNGNLKDTVYNIFGRDVSNKLIFINGKSETGEISVSGYIGKPELSRGNRNFENYYINKRFIKNALLNKAIESGYSNFMMQHQYPFTLLLFDINTAGIDINVHPNKMDVRFLKVGDIFDFITNLIHDALKNNNLIREACIDNNDTKQKQFKSINYERKEKLPEPFEVNRLSKIKEDTDEYKTKPRNSFEKLTDIIKNEDDENKTNQETSIPYKQLSLISEEAKPYHKIIGQIFNTYWIIEMDNKMYIIDQHAAHEKVNYERIMSDLDNNEIIMSQGLNPPIILSLSENEAQLVEKYQADFLKMGFEIEHFGGKEFAVRSIPDILPSLNKEYLLKEIIGNLSDDIGISNPQILLEKIASMACKTSVKGNQRITTDEARKLIDSLLLLDNPYNCPHGRPTIIEISKNEIEKKFKRVL